MRGFGRIAFVLAASLLVSAGLQAQSGQDAIQEAMHLYSAGSFEKAFTLISVAVPEGTTDADLKSAAASALADMSISEYMAKNYKNAYDGFRKALKYDPTNAKATQYFLRIRRELDVSNLANQGSPRAQGVSPAALPSPQPASSGDLSTQSAQLQAMEEELKKASGRLSTMESSVASTSSENQALKGQINQQIDLISKLLDQQKRAQASGAQAAQDQAVMARTMELLSALAEQEKGGAGAQSADIKALAESLAAQQNQLASGNALTRGILVALFVFLGLALVVIVLVAVMAARASKRRQGASAYAAMFAPGVKPIAGAEALALGAPPAEGQLPLLEYAGPAPEESGAVTDARLMREALRSERLKLLYDEVQSGTLSWETVRTNIGELETAIRAEILAVVERKLEEGDLISDEAVLPVLFPFLTEYDDFLREKAGALAKRALADASLNAEDRGSVDPFSLKNLMDIPRALGEAFKGQDQSLVTARLARGIGKELGLSAEECNGLYKAALAHDCGYLVLDRGRLESIVSKPEITDDDFEFIKSHTVKGIAYFGGLEPPAEIRDAILYHHERNDGSGYPDGLRKDAIPRVAKILGAAETFAALVSKRSYRQKRDIQHALAIISDGARTKFDADIVEALVKAATAGGYR